MLPYYIQLSLTVDMFLLVIERAIGTCHILPLGGDSFSQLGILLCLGVAIETFETLRSRRKK